MHTGRITSPRPWIRLLFVCVVCALALVGPSSRALASHPGVNGRIAYTDLIDKGTSTQRRAIFLSPGGQFSHPAVHPPALLDADSDPAWSPNGKTLAFARRHGQTGQWGIYAADEDGSNLRLVAGHLDGLGNPTHLQGRTIFNLVWSPDGQRIGFFSRDANGVKRIVSVLASGGTVPQFQTHVSSFFSAFSTVSGFDWTRAGFVYDCITLWTGPKVLFCTADANTGQVVSVNAIGPEHGPMADGFLQGGGTGARTQWRPTGANSENVMFTLSYAADPANPSATRRTEVFSMNATTTYPSNGYLGSGLVQHAKNDDVVSCTNTVNGNTTTTYQPRFSYAQATPSPDGLYFVARRVEVQTTTNTAGQCAFQNVNPGLYVFRNSGGLQSTVAATLDADDPAWQPDPAALAIRITDGHTHPLDDLKVELLEWNGRTPTPYILERKTGGTYTFDDVPPGEYAIRVTLRDEVGQAFDIRDSFPADGPVWAERKVTVSSGGNPIPFDFKFDDSPTIEDSNVFPIVRDRLDDFAAIYWSTYEFVKWVRENLTPSTGVPVFIHAFATQTPNPDQDPATISLSYSPAFRSIFIGEEDSAYESRDDAGDSNPVNGEWHEFTHHLFNQFVSSVACPGLNHHGYENPTSCDSLDEGFSGFLPTQVHKNPQYAGIANFEDHSKPWNYRVGIIPFKLKSTEEISVAALFWDLTDSTNDFEITEAITHGGVHIPTVYSDEVTISLTDLWAILTANHPATVRELQDAFALDPRFDDITVDVDHDLVLDVSRVDALFLMQGFFPIVNDQVITPTHGTYHYDVNSARVANPSNPPNLNVGHSGHTEYYFAINSEGHYDFTLPAAFLHPRDHLAATPEANFEIQASDASGTPLADVEVELTVQYPDSESTLRRNLGTGTGVPIPLELPTHFDYLLPIGAPLPPCRPETDRRVSVTLRGFVNGYASTNSESFHNCEYLQAMAAAPGQAALAFGLSFPEDSLPPVTTATRRSVGHVVGDYTVGSWTVEVDCADPVDGGFASGCHRREYGLDGAPFVPYVAPIEVTTPGLHQLDVRSVDAAGNVESSQRLTLGVVGANESIPPVTTASTDASVPPVGNKTVGTWTVTLTCDDANGGDAGSGCLRTEYGVNGAPLVSYTGPFVLSTVGVHTIRYRSLDVLQNAEALRNLQLIVATPDMTPPYTSFQITADGVESPIETKVMGAYVVELEGCFDSGPATEMVSGCDRTEYALDGGSFQAFTEPFVIDAIGPHSLDVRSIDHAGNIEPRDSYALEIVAVSDDDADGTVDYADNCSSIANADQLDTNFDGYGNLCDPDFNGNGTIDSHDGSLLKFRLGADAEEEPDLDLNGDGDIDAADLEILKSRFRRPPGPAYGYDFYIGFDG